MDFKGEFRQWDDTCFGSEIDQRVPIAIQSRMSGGSRS